MNTKYIWLLTLLIVFTACNSPEDFKEEEVILPELTAGEANFSNYISVGSSFTAGFTDNALFIASQQNSFPNLLSQQFTLLGGGDFTQPLMNDNIGGFLFDGVPSNSFGPRLFFNGTGPQVLPATSTTEASTVLTGPFNNMGVPGAKSFHLTIAGYGALNPYFGRMASSTTASIIGDAVAQNPTFFTLSEVGGNDILSYATNGGDPSLGTITDTPTFEASFNTIVNALTAKGAKGVVTNVPYIASLPHFTTVPYNPLSPDNPSFGPLIPTLNGVFGQLNQVFAFLGVPERSITFSPTTASAVVIKDKKLKDLSAQIANVLNASPTFPAFVQSFGLPVEAAPLVANFLGTFYGQIRQATATDLFVLPSSFVIGTVNTTTYAYLINLGLPANLAGQFAVEGITNPLEDKWVLLPSEQDEIKTATDAYNLIIESVAASKGLALVNFKDLLIEASTTGISDGNFTLNTTLVTGGLIGLDGIHLTSRGYAVLANRFLKAIDTTYHSNFEASESLINVGNYPTNYSPTLQ